MTKSYKKGTDKPIEIFIALFVILAVAMVILKMFSSQIEQKQRELRDAADKAKIEEERGNINQFCDARCSEAVDEAGIVNYCRTYYDRKLDLDNNKNYNDYVKSISIEGACEDRIYCAQFKPCGALNMKTCVQRLCAYFKNTWNKQDVQSQDSELAKFIEGGNCYDSVSGEDRRNHWYSRLFSGSLGCAAPPTCLKDLDTWGDNYGATCVCDTEGNCEWEST